VNTTRSNGRSGNGNGKRLPITLTAQEVEALLVTVNTGSATGLRNRAMLATMLGAGLRVSEVLHLRAVDVDLSRGEVRVNEGKGGKDRVVPVNDEALGWLRAWNEKRASLGLNGRAPFFVGLREGATGSGYREHGQGLKPRYLQGLLKRLGEVAGIEKRVSPHILRHTYATGLLDQGFNIREVQTLLGHSNVATTQVYTHVNPEELRRKVQGETKADEHPAVGEETLALMLTTLLMGLPVEQRRAIAAKLGRE